MSKKSGKRIVLGIFSVEEIMSMHHSFRPGEPIPVFQGDDGLPYTARVYSVRLRTFGQNTNCVKCGLKATHFKLERMTDNPPGIAHFNMYGIRDNEEILFTKDHIIPRARGGSNAIENMQTMCETCNNRKGSRMEPVYKLEVIVGENKFTKKFSAYEDNAVKTAKSILFDAGVTNQHKWSLFRKYKHWKKIR